MEGALMPDVIFPGPEPISNDTAFIGVRQPKHGRIAATAKVTLGKPGLRGTPLRSCRDERSDPSPNGRGETSNREISDRPSQLIEGDRAQRLHRRAGKIGRASCREREGQYV